MIERRDRDIIINNLKEKGYPFSSYEISMNEDGETMQLGKGGYAVVYEAKAKRFEATKALKIVGFEAGVESEKMIRTFQREIGLQSKLAEMCNNVVRIDNESQMFLKLERGGGILDIVDAYEVMENGNLDYYIQNYTLFQFILMEKLTPIITCEYNKPHISIDRLKDLDEREVIKLAIDVATAIDMAHKMQVSHRDIKLENIFWDEKLEKYKLGDFGIALMGDVNLTNTLVGTKGNMAPEAIFSYEMGPYDGAKNDIYAFGITIYRLLNELRYPGAEGFTPNRSFQYCSEDVSIPKPKHGSDRLIQIVIKACSYKADDRQNSMAEILQELQELQNVIPSESTVVSEIPIVDSNGEFTPFGLETIAKALMKEKLVKGADEPAVAKEETVKKKYTFDLEQIKRDALLKAKKARFDPRRIYEQNYSTVETFLPMMVELPEIYWQNGEILLRDNKIEVLDITPEIIKYRANGNSSETLPYKVTVFTYNNALNMLQWDKPGLNEYACTAVFIQALREMGLYEEVVKARKEMKISYSIKTDFFSKIPKEELERVKCISERVHVFKYTAHHFLDFVPESIAAVAGYYCGESCMKLKPTPCRDVVCLPCEIKQLMANLHPLNCNNGKCEDVVFCPIAVGVYMRALRDIEEAGQ